MKYLAILLIMVFVISTNGFAQEPGPDDQVEDWGEKKNSTEFLPSPDVLETFLSFKYFTYDFHEFGNFISKYNFIKPKDKYFTFGVGLTYSAYNFIVNIDLGTRANYKYTDSSEMNFETTNFSLGLGYGIFFSRDIILTPYISYGGTVFNYSYLNSKYDVSLDDYMMGIKNEKSISFGFEEMAVGLNLRYCFFKSFIIGLKGEFVFPTKYKRFSIPDKGVTLNNGPEIKNDIICFSIYLGYNFINKKK